MKTKQIWKRWKQYLITEIGIEYKACLYFFCILFYYCCYRLSVQDTSASILHMAEMILCTYLMGYIQIFVFRNFDEVEKPGKMAIAGTGICTLLYSLTGWLFGWFDRKASVTIGFSLYILFAYLCVFIINRIKREADTKLLNDMLAAYQREGEENE